MATLEKKRRLDPSDRAEAILQGAITFFSTYGFDGSTRDLALGIGVTQPLIYRYFPNKEALLDRVYEEVFVTPWKTVWEDELQDRTVPIEVRLNRFYSQYSKMILSYEWVRLFMFAGLKGLDFNARYLKFLRKSAFDLVVREVRAAEGINTEIEPTNQDAELVWGLHAAIFYLGVRKHIYGMPIPEDLDADIALRVEAFLRGAPAAFSR